MPGFYARLRDKRQDDQLLQDCIETVINRLEEGVTSADQPGMLLGKIQSGKTRGFLGVMARAFDRGFDVALVFTKGTTTLARQTVRRISFDFKDFIDDEEVSVYDIMEMPERLTRSELRRKIVVVAKKEANNLQRVIDLFADTYKELASKRVLLVDDEADMASVRFVRPKDKTAYAQGTIAQQMDNLRALVPQIAFLQVTATPYALYLQPDAYAQALNDFVFFPKKPAFTVLLPIHGGYVGGDDYFGNFDETDARFYLYREVPEAEQDALRSADGRTIREDRIWTSTNIKVLRESIMTFLLAVVVRRFQQKRQEKRLGKYAMIIHNDTQRAAHQWQWDTVERLRAAFEKAAAEQAPALRDLFTVAYASLEASVHAHGGQMPDKKRAFEAVTEMILDGELNVQRVNSDVQLAPLLDPDTAELRLRTQANIFIGGSILDRGITIPSLIAFYYGRNPKRMQADTVLQHSRMYGARDKQDLAITRFYTSRAVYDRLQKIHQLEDALRHAFESGGNDGGVVFIQNDPTLGVIPCAPSKIAVSDVVTVKPSDFYFPSGFDTVKGKAAKKATERIAELLEPYLEDGNSALVPLSTATEIIELAKQAIDLGNAPDFQWSAMTSLLKYYCKANENEEINILVETGRELNREKSGQKSGLSVLGTALREVVRKKTSKKPALVLLQQAGSKALSWSGDMPFWWPVLATPSNSKPCVYANDSSSKL